MATRITWWFAAVLVASTSAYGPGVLARGARPAVRRAAAQPVALARRPRTFKSYAEYELALRQEAELPEGFSVGLTGFTFKPAELGGTKTAVMNLTLIVLDEPSNHFAAVFTRNAYPGAPVKVGRKRLASRLF